MGGGWWALGRDQWVVSIVAVVAVLWVVTSHVGALASPTVVVVVVAVLAFVLPV